eukprot:9536980-Alexandrium_andersonii.AAC.1
MCIRDRDPFGRGQCRKLLRLLARPRSQRLQDGSGVLADGAKLHMVHALAASHQLGGRRAR